MFARLLKGKLHGATVTEAKLHYTGSIAIDSVLMDAAGIMPYEAVLVSDLTNGHRLETYAVPAEANSGRIAVLGAAAHLIKPKDRIIVFSFGYYSPEEAGKVKPKVIVLDQDNKIKELSREA
jgi:aspartate 1-decarboxylase